MAEAPKDANGRLQLNKPRYDQSEYLGRAKHFFTITDPRNIFVTASQLDQAKKLVENYRYAACLVASVPSSSVMES